MKKRKLSFKKRAILKLLKLIALDKNEMAHYAWRNTKIYKDLYIGVDPNGIMIKKIDFTKLPLLKKEYIFKKSPFDMLSNELKNNVFKYAETTGSTGSPTPSFFTPKEFKGSVLLSNITTYSDLLKKVMKTNRNAVCGLACGFTIANASFHQILDKAGFLTINVDARTTISPPHRIARLLTRFKPSVIVASETDFLSWMRVLKEEYRESYYDVLNNLRVLISTAELCSTERSNMIEEEFNIIHIDNYSCVEGFFSLPCLCGEKHILPIYHTEVLNHDLLESAEYGSGRLAFTNLLRKSTPLVRYMLDDYITIYPSKCEFGFKKSIIPHGRYELTIEINGKQYGNRHVEALLFKKNLFGEYIVSVYDDKIEITVEEYSNKKIFQEEIINRFETEFGLKTFFTIVPYGKIRDYHEIRMSKPLYRFIDNRSKSKQEMPIYT